MGFLQLTTRTQNWVTVPLTRGNGTMCLNEYFTLHYVCIIYLQIINCHRKLRPREPVTHSRRYFWIYHCKLGERCLRTMVLIISSDESWNIGPHFVTELCEKVYQRTQQISADEPLPVFVCVCVFLPLLSTPPPPPPPPPPRPPHKVSESSKSWTCSRALQERRNEVLRSSHTSSIDTTCHVMSQLLLVFVSKSGWPKLPDWTVKTAGTAQVNQI